MIHLCIREYSKTEGQHIFSFSFFLLCACAVNVYVCSRVCIHVYVCACVYTSQADTRCLFSQISTLCVSMGYSNELGTPQFLFVSSSNGIPVSASRMLGLQSSCLPGFYVHFGTQTPVFMLA